MNLFASVIRMLFSLCLHVLIVGTKTKEPKQLLNKSSERPLTPYFIHHQFSSSLLYFYLNSHPLK